MAIKKLREFRFFKGMTLDDVYLLSGRRIYPQKLSRIERGIIIPTEDEKNLIAKALREPVSKVFPKSEEEEK